MSKAVFYAMEPAYLQAYIDHKNEIASMLATGNYNLEMIDKVKAEIESMRSESRELYTVDDEYTAHINVSGPLEPKPDPCSVMFDIEMTTYCDIIEAITKAESDPRVQKITIHFSTPGGNVVGLFRACDYIYNCTKPTIGIAHSLCASAGQALIAMCDKSYAENISAELGSIGVATEYVDTTEADGLMGIKRYVLTSANAENKRPDVTTKDGRDKITARLTSLESVFIDYVAKGRAVSRETILSDYGRGGILIARDALRVGIIDGILSTVIDSSIDPESQNTIDDPIEVAKKRKCIINPIRNATAKENADNSAKEKTNKGESSMEMTEEKLKEFASDIATKTAASVQEKMSAEFKARDEARASEEKRKAGFEPLYQKFPNQKTLIDAEVSKEGATASALFALTVAEAETARVAALSDQEKNEASNADPLKGKNQKHDTSGDDFLASMGVDAKKEA